MTVAETVATTKVAGANRIAKARPNIPDCIANSLTSIAGPTTRKTSRGTNGTMVRLAATNASASEHNASTTASSAITSTPSSSCPARCAINQSGTTTCSAAAAAAPITR